MSRLIQDKKKQQHYFVSCKYATFVLVCSINVCSGLLNVCSGLFFQRLFWSAQRLVWFAQRLFWSVLSTFVLVCSTFVLVCSIYVCSGLLYLRLFWSALFTFVPVCSICWSWPRVHKDFQNNDQYQTEVLILWIFFKTYYYYLTIDCWCLIKYVLQTRPLGILSLFIKEKVHLIVKTVMKIWAH